MSGEAHDRPGRFHRRQETGLSRMVVVALGEHVSCDLDGEAVIFDVATGRYHGLNASGTRVWNMIQSPTAVSAIRDALLAEYEVEPNRCGQDLMRLLEDLLERGLIRLNEEAG